MAKITIKNHFTNETIFESEKETIKEAVLDAIKSKANLSEADLSEANLSEANLSEANLSEANLSWANLSWANLSKANYWKTNFWKCKVTKETKEQIITIMELRE